MSPALNDLIQAYRPLYLHGLRMDGHSRPPSIGSPFDSPPRVTGSTSRKRMLLVALTGLRHIMPNHRGSP
ncbi:hypothetical protein [Rhodanobacter sp. L36]|uniref:hypothetical protein n=1 Tax=Rhodanobacter sp. L36 TaxID=1747221 RepID=UPI00131D12D7|nr:hypothetical protein [Rhodanobacter sp. L36]